MVEADDDFEYPTVRDVLTIHEVIVESDDDTERGVRNRGGVEYALESVREGHFGEVPQTIHQKAFQLLRLLVANHPFVDGNKRTALASTVVLYALNDYDLAYDSEIKDFLKQFGTDEAGVDRSTVLAYLRKRSRPLPEEYRASYAVLRQLFRSGATGGVDDSEGNGYTDQSVKEE